jgi:hypothetical protein
MRRSIWVAVALVIACVRSEGAAAPDAGALPTAAELERLTLREVEIRAALPLARRGRIFRTYWLDKYFRAQPWYRPTGFDPNDLPPRERELIAMLRRYQAARPRAELDRRAAALAEREWAAHALCPQMVVTSGQRTPNDTRRVLALHGDRFTLWNLASGTSRELALDSPVSVNNFGLSRDGLRIACTESSQELRHAVSVWDVATGQRLGKPLLESYNLDAAYTVSPDATLAMVAQFTTSGASQPRTWRLVALDQGRTLLTLHARHHLLTRAERFSVSSDRRMVLALSTSRVWLWRVPESPVAGEPVLFLGEDETVDDAELSPDGRWIAHLGSSSNAVTLVATDEPSRRKVLTTPGLLRFVSFSPDGRTVMAGTREQGLAIWEISSGELLWSRPDRYPSLACAKRWAAYFPSGNEVAMVGERGALEVLDLRSKNMQPTGAAAAAAGAEQEENTIEAALIDQARGRSPTNPELRELSFEEQPDIFEQPLEEKELLAWAKSGHDLRAVEALIYARRGRPFASPLWREYVQHLDRYHADASYSEAKLTRIDRANLALLATLRQRLAPRPPAPPPDPASVVPRTAFPPCPAGATLSRATFEDGIERLMCARGTIADGPSWSWFPTGRLAETRAFHQGKEHGRRVIWRRTGARASEGELVANRQQGVWRTFHRNGTLAEESTWEAGTRHGPRRRFFDSGKPALNARYRHGIPTGSWTTYYDSGQPAMTATFSANGNAGTSKSFLPDGSAWPPSRKLEANADGSAATSSPLQHLDLESLPPELAKACPEGGKSGGRSLPPRTWKPVLAAAVKASQPDAEYPPSGCPQAVRVSCAPDLDGDGTAEVLAEIDHRVLLNEQTDCNTKNLGDVWEFTSVVALSPPGVGRPGWTPKGLIGYKRYDAGEGGSTISLEGFVRLPSGEPAVAMRYHWGGGDCEGGESGALLVLRAGRWVAAARQTLQECNQSEEPEAGDVF